MKQMYTRSEIESMAGGGGGGGAKLYKHEVVSDGNHCEIINFSSTKLTPDNLSNELRKGYCYIRYFYEDDIGRAMASDCVLAYDDGYEEGSWQDKAITLHYLNKPSSGAAVWSTIYLCTPPTSAFTDTVTEI